MLIHLYLFQIFLKRFQYDNAVSQDLWDALEEVKYFYFPENKINVHVYHHRDHNIMNVQRIEI